MILSCLCGAVNATISDKPEFIHECNCMLCRKSGARWAYFSPDLVKITGATRAFQRPDKSVAAAEVHSCQTCNVTSYFVLTEAAIAAHGNTMMGVNMALAEPADLSGIELRYPDGAAWSGEGEFGYVRDPVTL